MLLAVVLSVMAVLAVSPFSTVTPPAHSAVRNALTDFAAAVARSSATAIRLRALCCWQRVTDAPVLASCADLL